jgi:hypothetical protein
MVMWEDRSTSGKWCRSRLHEKTISSQLPDGTFPNCFRCDENLKEIHSRLVTSDLVPSFRFVHACPSKGSKSSESDKGDPGRRTRP